jgi:Zn-dependent protease with chaperone function
MDFFARQDQARRKTGILLVYFGLAVVLTIFTVYLATALSLQMVEKKSPVRLEWHYANPDSPRAFTDVLTDGLPWFDKELFLLVTVSVGLIIFLGSSVMTFRLSQGGKSVATLLGGHPLNPSTTKADEVKLRNVVEEMAIASGLPMPEIYLLDHEDGINAFAAGYTTSDAVIGVTRGSLKVLTRDELQGVIAHEFSHILNGDMRLNMRLSCLTHGILFIAETGKWLIEIAFRAPRSSRREGGGQLMLALGLAGLALTAIGSIGYFFTSALKAAISRQREFLADAAAVQFTRNPGGISGVLKKIGGFVKGSKLEAPEAGQASHFFFSQGITFFLGNLLSTHPPLAERILAIDPAFQHEFPQIKADYRAEDYQGSLEESFGLSQAAGFLFQGDISHLERPEDVLKTVGQLKPVQIQQAARLRTSVPDLLFQAAHEPFGARALVIATLLVEEVGLRQLSTELSAIIGSALAKEVQSLLPQITSLSGTHLITLIDLSLPALRQLSSDQFVEFRQMIQHLVELDSTISLFEYTLQKMLFRHLDSFFSPAVRQSRIEFNNLKPILPSILTLLGALAYFDSEDPLEVTASYEKGCQQLNLIGESYPLPTQDHCGLTQVDQSLDILQKSAPGLKRNILYSCATVVMFNHHITEEEATLLRAIADSLDCPIPPFAHAE